jgi:DNA-binding NarL/FixJ family response regulator
MSQGRRITRGRLITVLEEVLDEGGYKMTVRSFNEILTRLGFRLGDYRRTHVNRAPSRAIARERCVQVRSRVALGETHQQIADAMGLDRSTVTYYATSRRCKHEA